MSYYNQVNRKTLLTYLYNGLCYMYECGLSVEQVAEYIGLSAQYLPVQGSNTLDITDENYINSFHKTELFAYVQNTICFMEEAGLSNAEIADYIGVSEDTIEKLKVRVESNWKTY